jgi:single-strand DNA-binding protein
MEPPFFGWRAGGARPCHVRQDISPDTIRRKTVQNIVEFHIIGRLGRIDAAKNVTHISVATNYNRREGETWKSDPQWHRVTLFDKLRDRLTNATIGDLVRITGRIGQSSYQADGRTNYSVDLIADGFAILAKAKVKTVEDDMQE